MIIGCLGVKRRIHNIEVGKFDRVTLYSIER